jgi:tetratricopeptide (TPR) repeat protein
MNGQWRALAFVVAVAPGPFVSSGLPPSVAFLDAGGAPPPPAYARRATSFGLAAAKNAAGWSGMFRQRARNTTPNQKPDTDLASLSAQADAARQANRIDEAIGLYRKALAARPTWTEGWWHLGTLLYDKDEFADAAAALRKATSLNPKVGTAWAMLGLCEFRLGQQDAALTHLQRGRALGVSADAQLRHVALYHEGLLLLAKSEFERAQEALRSVSADGVESDDLTVALGMSVLRRLPSTCDLQRATCDVRQMSPDPSELDLLMRAGHAETLSARKQFDDARRDYERLVADFPTTRNVHYALGRYFVDRSQPDEAMAAYKREIEITLDHVPARLGIAAILAETDPARALPYAEEAVKLNPRIPLGHYLLGSLLLHTDQTTRAIAELETAERSVKDDPGVYYALGRAYARAGRKQDADRARAVFKRLTEERQKTATKGRS